MGKNKRSTLLASRGCTAIMEAISKLRKSIATNQCMDWRIRLVSFVKKVFLLSFLKIRFHWKIYAVMKGNAGFISSLKVITAA